MPSFKVGPKIQETSNTAGVGTYTLLGAPAGHRSFSTLGAGNFTRYHATNGTDFEEGIGEVLTGPNRLARTAVLDSSNGGAAVNWPGTTITLRCGLISGDALPRKLSKSVAGGAGTTVLTQAEQRHEIKEFTGALTGNRVIEVDTTVGPGIVHNNTTGAFTLTYRVTGQTGVVVPRTRKVVLYCDGTDIRAAGIDYLNNNGSEFPAGTKMLFQQTAAPVGWTKDATHNDKALRIVSGTVGSGGNTAFTSVFGAGKLTGGHTLTLSQSPSHAHTIGAGGSGTPASTNATPSPDSSLGTITTTSQGGGGSHDHSLSLDLQYVDVIIATKD